LNLQKIKRKLTDLARFGAVGIPGTALAGLAFIGLTEWFSVPYWRSLIIARTLNTIINFLLQKELLFGSTTRITTWLVARYVLVSGLLISLNTVALRVLVEDMKIHYIFAQLLLVFPLTYLAEFLISRVFKNKRHT